MLALSCFTFPFLDRIVGLDMFYFTTSKGFLTTAWHVSAKQEAMICYKCTFTLLLIIALLCRVVLLNSYESQKQAAHGKEAVIADARPLNLLTVSALVMKLTLFEVAYIVFGCSHCTWNFP